MPRISQYTASENLGLRPSETGIQAVAGAARRLEGDFSSAAQAQLDTGSRAASTIRVAGEVATDYIDNQQISQGAPAFAGLVAAKTKQWDDAFNADPNNPNVAPKFLSELEPELEKFKSAFLTEKGQRWAEARVDQFRTHMFTKTAADVSGYAGHKAIVENKQTVNSLSNTVRGDPSSIDFALRTYEETIDAVIGTSNVKGAMAAKLRNEMRQTGYESIVKGAALGYIEKTGEVPPWATDEKYSKYINANDLKAFANAAKAQKNAIRLQERQLQIDDLRVKQEAAKVAVSKSFDKNVSFDAETGKWAIKPEFFPEMMKINKDFPGIYTDSIKTYLTWGADKQKERREIVVDDPVFRNKLLDGFLDTESPTTEVDILFAENNRKISPQTSASMRNLAKALEEKPLKDPRYQAAMTAVKGILGNGEKGTENYGMFLLQFLPEYIKQSRGESKPNTLDLRDENSLISTVLKPWRLTDEQKFQDRLEKLQPGIFGLGGGVAGFAKTPDGKVRMVSGIPVPAPLGGIAALDYNPARQQWRDQASGIIYDRTGQPVK